MASVVQDAACEMPMKTEDVAQAPKRLPQTGHALPLGLASFPQLPVSRQRGNLGNKLKIEGLGFRV